MVVRYAVSWTHYLRFYSKVVGQYCKLQHVYHDWNTVCRIFSRYYWMRWSAPQYMTSDIYSYVFISPYIFFFCKLIHSCDMHKEGQNIHQSKPGSTYTHTHTHTHARTHTHTHTHTHMQVCMRAHTISTRMDSVIEEINVHNWSLFLCIGDFRFLQQICWRAKFLVYYAMLMGKYLFTI